jgi:hypothetical protein
MAQSHPRQQPPEAEVKKEDMARWVEALLAVLASATDSKGLKVYLRPVDMRLVLGEAQKATIYMEDDAKRLFRQ